MSTYVLYGDLADRATASLASVLHAKRLPIERVEPTPSLSLTLAARAGHDTPPYLRTPEGFLLGDLHAILEWLERVHPTPALLPATPVRRTLARMLEDWIELWLAHWPRRSWSDLDALGQHLEQSGFLLGSDPTRPDWMLAAWVETEVAVHPEAREHLSRSAPRLLLLGDALLGWTPDRAGSSDAEEDGQPIEDPDDALPISLLGVVEVMARDYHGYLVANHRALKDGEMELELELGLGLERLTVDPECERRRVSIARELAALDRAVRRDVARMLEPLGAWHALTLPPVLAEPDPADPRSL